LTQRTFDDVDAVRGIVAYRNAATPRAVHTDSMNFVAVGEGAVLYREVADRLDRGHVAVHRIDALERDQLGYGRIYCAQQLFQMSYIVVAPDALFAAGIANAGDHAGVIELVREDHAAWQQAG